MYKASAWNRASLHHLANWIEKRTDKPWSFGEMPSCYMAFAQDLWGGEFGISNVISHSPTHSFSDKFLTLLRVINVRPLDEEGEVIDPESITRRMGAQMLRRLAAIDETYFKYE